MRLLSTIGLGHWKLALVAILLHMNSFSEVRAAVISYVEGTDLGSPGAETNLGAFGVGINTVQGNINSSRTVGDNADIFFAQLPIGMKIDSVAFQISAYQNVGTGMIFQSQALAFDWPTTALLAFADFFSSGPGGLAPLSGGALPGYSFGMVAPNDTGIIQGASYNYLWTITVSQAIPEPTTLALLSAGLFGLGLTRRRPY